MTAWKTISTKTILSNKWLEVSRNNVINPNGKKGIYFVIHKSAAVMIIPLTKNREIYLIQIDRYPTEKINWEIPAGSSEGKDELSAARRELEEETGLTSSDWSKLGELEMAPGMTNQIIHVFAAYNVNENNTRGQLDEGINKIMKASFDNVLTMIKNKQIVSAPVIASLMLAKMKLKL